MIKTQKTRVSRLYTAFIAVREMLGSGAVGLRRAVIRCAIWTIGRETVSHIIKQTSSFELQMVQESAEVLIRRPLQPNDIEFDRIS